MRFIIKFLFLQLIFIINIFPQFDTIISYDVRTKNIEYKIINIPNDTATFLYTGWDYGTYPGFVSLSTEAPSDIHTPLMPADSLFNLNIF